MVRVWDLLLFKVPTWLWEHDYDIKLTTSIDLFIHYGDVIMDTMVSQITSLTMFTQPFIQMQINENIKAHRHWPLCGEFPAQMASNMENVSIWWRYHDPVIFLENAHKRHSIARLWGQAMWYLLWVYSMICTYIYQCDNSEHPNKILAPILFLSQIVSNYVYSMKSLFLSHFLTMCHW